ncbi:MAG TPA: rhodanese-like domain-containing protein [Planctomycetota bacterium]|nr:rhodanese-like domain-containing protein [Planctomycetota bacterium]
MSGTATISPAEVQALRANGTVALIDVRTPAEYREVHAEGAVLMPLDQLDAAALGAGTPVYILCETGPRAFKAAEKLKAAGRADVVVVEGGTQRWAEAGLPVVRGRKAIGMFRQVRIVAGTLVLVGVGVGWFVHPGFYGLAAFVGGGLLFSGITDTCGMAWVLGKMPWNTSLK